MVLRTKALRASEGVRSEDQSAAKGFLRIFTNYGGFAEPAAKRKGVSLQLAWFPSGNAARKRQRPWLRMRL